MTPSIEMSEINCRHRQLPEQLLQSGEWVVGGLQIRICPSRIQIPVALKQLEAVLDELLQRLSEQLILFIRSEEKTSTTLIATDHVKSTDMATLVSANLSLLVLG